MAFARQEQDEELQRLLRLNEMGMHALQEVTAALRESSREVLSLVQRNRYLEQLAWTDPLTGLLNRRGFDEELEREDARARRNHTTAAVVLLDVRGLKSVNDNHGHTSGDALLRAVGSALRVCARGSDVAARFGGDEFAGLLADASLEGAHTFVSRVRAAVHAVRLSDDIAISVALAAGIATRDEAGSLRSALELADQRLLLSKRAEPA
jgi:diguanylate cyclase (GGDEF)-like protein